MTQIHLRIAKCYFPYAKFLSRCSRLSPLFTKCAAKPLILDVRNGVYGALAQSGNFPNGAVLVVVPFGKARLERYGVLEIPAAYRPGHRVVVDPERWAARITRAKGTGLDEIALFRIRRLPADGTCACAPIVIGGLGCSGIDRGFVNHTGAGEER